MLVELCGDEIAVWPGTQPYRSCLTNESFMAYVLPNSGINCVYADLSMLRTITPKTMAMVGGFIAGNFRSGLTQENHRDFYLGVEIDVSAFPAFGEREIAIIKELEATRITADHHLFVGHKEIRSMAKSLASTGDTSSLRQLKLANAVLDMLLSRGIDSKVTVMTMLTYIFVAPLYAREFLASLIMMSSDRSALERILKLESGAAKQQQTLFRNDLSAVFELNVLFNRGYAELDWHKEKANRVSPNTVQIPRSTVYQLASKIFQHAKMEGKSAKRMQWSDYWTMRWANMPGGSVVSQYQADIALKRSLPIEGRMKAAWFACLDTSDYNRWLDRTPEIYASTSTKYEWGKVRALYGCDVTSFLHADFGMHLCEETLPSYFPVGRRANSSYVTKLINKFATGVPFCFDFDDFNSQHSTSSMQAVVDAWMDVFQHDLTQEQLSSVAWTSASLISQKVRYNDLAETVQINGTLLSGWRLTSFVNTVLNRVYLDWATIEDNAIYALHNGDDMYASVPTLLNAMRVVSKAQELGIRAQVSKTNIGTIGEFLRVDTRARTDQGAQYMARAVATCVHGRIETGAPNDLKAMLEATITRADALITRGADSMVVEVLRDHQLRFVSELFDASSEVVEHMLNAHPVQGGRNTSAGITCSRLEQVARHDMSSEYASAFNLIRRGVNEYVDKIREKFDLPRELVKYDEIYKKAVNSLMRDKINYRIVTEDDHYVHVYRGVYKADANSLWVAPIAQSRSLGYIVAKQLMEVTGPVAAKIRDAPNPIRFMQAVL